jgi:hypothetical protein
MKNDIITYLKYTSYKTNRLRAPDIAAEKWALIFGEEASVFEAMLIAEEKHVMDNMKLAEKIETNLEINA